jgi:hypothetical protein
MAQNLATYEAFRETSRCFVEVFRPQQNRDCLPKAAREGLSLWSRNLLNRSMVSRSRTPSY